MEKKYNVRIMPEAARDLLNIFDYISGELAAPQAAHGLLNNIDEAISRLALFPGSFEKAKDVALCKKGYRVMPVDHYLVFYVVTGETIKVRRVLYNKRLYSRILF